MRATVMYGAHDVRVETVPDARIVEPTDALVRVTRASVDLAYTDCITHQNRADVPREEWKWYG